MFWYLFLAFPMFSLAQLNLGQGFINVAKKDNASIVLSDSVALSDSRVNFKELSGFLGKAISALREARDSGTEKSAEDILGIVTSGMASSEVPCFLSNKRNEKRQPHGPVNIDLTSEEDSAARAVWRCTVCTFRNSARDRTCQTCGEEHVAEQPETIYVD